MTLDTHSRGFHAYMDIWNPKIGEELAILKEPENEHDKFAVAVKRNNTVSRDVVGHIGRHISKVIFQFLSLPGSTASAQVTGGRVNRGAGDGLEIPIKMKLVGHKKSVEWINKKIKAIDNEINSAVERCMK